jgi:hypothetical protein
MGLSLSKLSVCLAMAVSIANHAEACMGVTQDMHDAPMSNGSSCSFDNGGSEDLRGNEARDLGNSLIMQQVSQFGSCGTKHMNFVVADCEARGAAVLYYSQVSATSPSTNESGGQLWNAEVRLGSPGHPTNFPASKSLRDFILDGRAMGYQAFQFEGILPRGIRYGDQYPHVQVSDWFDPYCGCKLFYPDSAGAQN